MRIKAKKYWTISLEYTICFWYVSATQYDDKVKKKIPGAGKRRILVESEVVGDGLVVGKPAVRPDRTGLRYTNLQGQLPRQRYFPIKTNCSNEILCSYWVYSH